MARVEQLVDMPYGVQRAAVLAIGVLLGLQVGLEDRLEDQHRRRFRDAIFYRGNSERTLTTPGLRNHHPSHRLRSIRSPSQLSRQFVQPSPDSVLLDVVELLAVHSRSSAMGLAAFVGEAQNILPVHLVVQSIEPIARRSLRFIVQRLLQLLNTTRG